MVSVWFDFQVWGGLVGLNFSSVSLHAKFTEYITTEFDFRLSCATCCAVEDEAISVSCLNDLDEVAIVLFGSFSRDTAVIMHANDTGNLPGI